MQSSQNPPFAPTTPQPQQDDVGHLRMLSLFHYILAAIGALFACFPLIHVAMGAMFMMNPDAMKSNTNQEQLPQWFGLIFVIIGAACAILGWTMAFFTFLSGRYLAQRKKRMFSFVVGAILCIFMPFGTILGIFTMVVLNRESVIRLYNSPSQPPPLV